MAFLGIKIKPLKWLAALGCVGAGQDQEIRDLTSRVRYFKMIIDLMVEDNNAVTAELNQMKLADVSEVKELKAKLKTCFGIINNKVERFGDLDPDEEKIIDELWENQKLY